MKEVLLVRDTILGASEKWLSTLYSIVLQLAQITMQKLILFAPCS